MIFQSVNIKKTHLSQRFKTRFTVFARIEARGDDQRVGRGRGECGASIEGGAVLIGVRIWPWRRWQVGDFPGIVLEAGEEREGADGSDLKRGVGAIVSG